VQRGQSLVLLLVHLLIVVVIVFITTVIHLVFDLQSVLVLLCGVSRGELWVVHSWSARGRLGWGLCHHHCQLVQYLEKL
jgi:hypothetical protein